MSVSPADQAAIRKQLSTESGNMKSPIVFAVVKLFLAAPNGSREWHYTGICGAAVLTIDREPQSDPKPRLIQIFEIPSNNLVFQQELYEAMPYEKPRDYFHAFETPKYIVGLLFADENDARGFHSRVLSQIPPPSAGKKVDSSIGNPYNFKHTRHIGYDPNEGFSLDQIPDDWKTLFKNAGIRKKDLTNKETAQMIYNTIQEHQEHTPAGQAPPLPAYDQQASAPSRPAVPGPRPPPPRRRAAPPVPGSYGSRVPAAPPVPVPAAPPVPIPVAPSPYANPGPPGPPGPPAAGSPTNSLNSGDRGGLLAAIRQGTALRKVTEEEKEEQEALPSMDHMSSAAQGGLLGALQMAMANRRVAMQDQGEGDGEESEEDDDWD